MGKKLIGCHSVDPYICQDEKKIYVDQTMILTPGVKDLLRNKGITIVYGKAPKKGALVQPVQATAMGEKSDAKEGTASGLKVKTTALEQVLKNTMDILKTEHRIADARQLKELSLKIINQINLNENKE